MIPAAIQRYLDKMAPGDTLLVKRAQDPAALIAAGKQYIDQGGCIEFNTDYTMIKKIRPFPHHTPHQVSYFFTFNPAIST